MYLSYFGLDSQPFSIVPDHRALYMSQSHREAVAHLLYALNQSGGFVQLTGEVGTGKTTVSRYILANLPEDVDVALLLNPRITEKEMLEAICDELGIGYSGSISQKDLVTRLNDYLLKAHSQGRKTVLIIDEAQNLSREVLEQVRLLTNLETSTDKLLQIILIGQPELSHTLQRHDLRQLSQRIVGRFKLQPLNRQETKSYIEHRLNICGVDRPLFTRGAISKVHRLSSGIPRLINVLCDRALMGAYAKSRDKVTRGMVTKAGKEVLNGLPKKFPLRMFSLFKYGALVAIIPVGFLLYSQYQNSATSHALVDGNAVDGNKTGIANGESEIQDDVSVSTADSGVLSSDQVADIEQSDSEASVSNNGVETGSERYDLIFRLGVPLQDEHSQEPLSQQQ